MYMGNLYTVDVFDTHSSELISDGDRCVTGARYQQNQ